MSKVLIVDDASFMRLSIKNMLEGLNLEFFDAANGIEAIETYALNAPDLVVLDITMPEMDGLTALKEIMKIDSGAKVLMCSAMGQQAMVVEAIHSGAKDFVVKPFDNDVFVGKVKKLLGL